MSTSADHRLIRSAIWVAVVVHLTTIVVYLANGLIASGVVMDPLRPVPIAAVYGAPAVLAVAGLRGRTALLLVAGIAAGVIAVFPFSLHSFLMAPVAIIYVVAYERLADAPEPRETMLAIVGCPLLLVAAFLTLILQDHPACYEQLDTGEVIVDRDPEDTATGSQVIEADSNVVAGGCSSDTIVWWEATASLALSSAAVAAGLYSVANSATRPQAAAAPQRNADRKPRRAGAK